MSATKTAHFTVVSTDYHITVCASARHSGEVMRALVQKAEQNGTPRCCPHNLNPMMTTRPQHNTNRYALLQNYMTP
jgi:hypothetical protein